MHVRLQQVLFFALAAFTLTPWCGPPIALLTGVVLALAIGNPFPRAGSRFARTLLQCCVVLLGFRMDLYAVLRAGTDGFVFTAVSIVATLLLGLWLGRALAIGGKTSALISSGTAICGGSAIAAVGSVIGAAAEEMAIATGCVFLLNAAALFLFPPLGHALQLTDAQFGLWAGIAIHDTSSVAGAGSIYGGSALDVAMAVKLSRVLWIIPLVLLMSRPRILALYMGATAPRTPAQARPQIPWFIGLFLLASCARTYIPAVAPWSGTIELVAKRGFALTLFLIGAGLTRKTLAAVGWRALVQGIVLWAFICVMALLGVRQFRT